MLVPLLTHSFTHRHLSASHRRLRTVLSTGVTSWAFPSSALTHPSWSKSRPQTPLLIECRACPHAVPCSPPRGAQSVCELGEAIGRWDGHGCKFILEHCVRLKESVAGHRRPTPSGIWSLCIVMGEDCPTRSLSPRSPLALAASTPSTANLLHPASS